MEKQYYLSSNGTQHGPFTLEVVLQKLEAQEHQWTDYVFDEEVGDWMLLLEHPHFSSKVTSTPKASSAPTAVTGEEVAQDPLKDKEWFILKEGSNHGPFSQIEIIQMLQEKNLFEYDYIFHSKLNMWKCIAEIEEFSPENIRKVKTSNDVSVSEVFFRRRHARAVCGASLIVHNNLKVFRGKSLEISAGGAGVMIESADLETGQALYLHFQPGGGVPPFNAVCEIVSKQFVREGGGPHDQVKYGVKFTNLSQSARENIKNYTTPNLKAA